MSTSPVKPKQKPVRRLKDLRRFLLQQEQQQEDRLSEDWTRSRLIEELYLCLMSIKEKDDEGIRRRKYEEQVSKKMYWMAIPPHSHSSVIVVSLKDLDVKVKQELLKDNKAMRDFTLKQAVGMICEHIDSRYYLLSAKRFLKVRLES